MDLSAPQERLAAQGVTCAVGNLATPHRWPTLWPHRFPELGRWLQFAATSTYTIADAADFVAEAFRRWA